MLPFLLSLNKKHSRYLSTIILSTFAICVGIWGFDVQNLIPSGTLASTEKWQMRIFLTLLTFVGSLLTSLVLTFIFYKKDTIDVFQQRTDELEQLKLQFDTVREEVASHGLKLKSMPTFVVSDTPPPNPKVGDFWIDTSNDKDKIKS